MDKRQSESSRAEYAENSTSAVHPGQAKRRKSGLLSEFQNKPEDSDETTFDFLPEIAPDFPVCDRPDSAFTWSKTLRLTEQDRANLLTPNKPLPNSTRTAATYLLRRLAAQYNRQNWGGFVYPADLTNDLVEDRVFTPDNSGLQILTQPRNPRIVGHRGHSVLCHWNSPKAPHQLLIYDSDKTGDKGPGASSPPKYDGTDLHDVLRQHLSRLFPSDIFCHGSYYAFYPDSQSQRNVAPEPKVNDSNICQIMAIAFAVEIILNPEVDPVLLKFNRSTMRKHLETCLSTGRLTSFEYDYEGRQCLSGFNYKRKFRIPESYPDGPEVSDKIMMRPNCEKPIRIDRPEGRLVFLKIAIGRHPALQSDSRDNYTAE